VLWPLDGSTIWDIVLEPAHCSSSWPLGFVEREPKFCAWPSMATDHAMVVTWLHQRMYRGASPRCRFIDSIFVW
jgi:hypothetical protein